MFFLTKCSEKGCKRSGSVALTQDAKFCNLHSKVEITTEVEVEVKGDENRDENGARIE